MDQKQKKPRQATLALRAHLEFFAALRALFGDLAQTSPEPEPAPEIDAQTRAELSEIALRLRNVEARLRPSSKIPTTKED